MKDKKRKMDREANPFLKTIFSSNKKSECLRRKGNFSYRSEKEYMRQMF